MRNRAAVLLLIALPLALLSASLAGAATTCTLSVVDTTMTLDGDCTTDATIVVPDGWTLDGAGYTITAVDPPGGHFLGAIVRNGGAWASAYNLTLTTSRLANVCDGGAARLRGIMFEGASGVISGNAVLNINQGPSGCQEGNGIEVRNAPFDGTHPNTTSVDISHNRISAYQKTGIVANGDVNVRIHHNAVGVSNSQPEFIAANSVQLGFGALGVIEANHIAGNRWHDTDWAATAVLLYLPANGAVVRHNNLMEGNADVGIYILADEATVDNNRVFETGTDGGYDVGIGNYGLNNVVTNNKVRGYAVPYEGVTGGKNKTIPRPHDP